MLRIHFFLICSILLILPSCSDNEENNMESEIINEQENLESLTLLDVSYGNHPLQTYDLYLPAGRSQTETKVILLIHGGGWVEGDKEDMTDFIALIQEAHPEHAIANLNYKLATPPTVPAFPNQFLDIKQAINHLEANQEELSFKAEFGVIGASAGAHLGLVYDYSYDTTDVIKFVVDIVGPTDFDDPFYANDPAYELVLAALIDEEAYENTDDIIQAISPTQLVQENSSPTLLFYGSQDPIVPLTNGQRLEAALVENDIEHQFVIYEAGHGDFDEAATLDLSNRISIYINTYLPIED